MVPKVWRKGAAAVGTECGSQHTRQKHGYRRRRSKSTVIGTNGPLRICASPYTFVSLPTRLETFSTLHSTSKPKHDIVTGDFKSWCPKCGGRVQQRLERNVAVSTRDRNTGIDDDGANRPLLARMGRYASALPRIELESTKVRHLARVGTRHATPKNQLRQLEAESGGLERGFLNMAEDSSANRSEWVGDDRVGKSFVVIFTNGDLPDNPMSLRECAVCGGVFTREQSREHSYIPCPPSSEQPFAIVSGRG